jgi:hypothetical protein
MDAHAKAKPLITITRPTSNDAPLFDSAKILAAIATDPKTTSAPAATPFHACRVFLIAESSNMILIEDEVTFPYVGDAQSERDHSPPAPPRSNRLMCQS